MRANDKIRFWIETNIGIVDHTDGLMTVDITRGMNQVNSPQEQVDAGIMRLVSRNPDLDPYLNSDIRAGVKLFIVEAMPAGGYRTLFTGKINGVTVDYQPKGKPQIVTITGLDLIGTMQQHILRDTFRARLGGTGMTTGGFLQEMNIVNTAGSESEIIGFTSYPSSSAILTYAEQGISNDRNGQSAWQTWSQASRQGLYFAYANRLNTFYAWPHYTNELYNHGFTHPRWATSRIQFDSRGGVNSYFDVKLSDGFDYGCNRMTVTVDGTPLPTVINDYSVTKWGVLPNTYDITQPASGPVVHPTFRDRVFAETVEPRREISEISYDNLKINYVGPKFVDIGDNIDIYHEIDVLTFNKKYGIVGIRHHIDANNWETTLVLKNWFIADEISTTPIIAGSASTGTTATEFNFSITNLVESEVTSVLWTIQNGHAVGGGPLTSSTLFTPPTVVWTAEPGTHYVWVDVVDKYGVTKRSNILTIVIAGVPVSNTWEYRINPSNNWLVEFKFTGSGADTYSWTWGDGTSNGDFTHGGHKFTSGGTKTVTLRATNSYGYVDVTKTITLSSTNTITNETGLKGIRYIYLHRNSAVTGANPEPILKQLRARTSTTLVNRAASAKIVSVINNGNRFYNANNDDVTATLLTSPNNLLLSSTSSSKILYGVRPVPVDTNVNEWGFIIDLGDIYYDIKYLDLRIEEPTGASTITKLVYADFDINNYGATYQSGLAVMSGFGTFAASATPPSLWSAYHTGGPL